LSTAIPSRNQDQTSILGSYLIRCTISFTSEASKMKPLKQKLCNEGS
jgi:hypothetical protein